METSRIKDVLFWLYEFLLGKEPAADSDYENLKRIFGPLDSYPSPEHAWNDIQTKSQHLWLYKEFNIRNKTRSKFLFLAQNLCPNEQCPLIQKGVESLDYTKSEDEILSLIVGSQGDLSTNSSNFSSEFIQAIISHLSDARPIWDKVFFRSLNKVKKAYYVDPYLGKFFLLKDKHLLGTDIVEGLSTNIPNLNFITSDESISAKANELDESKWKVIKKNQFQFHDRFIICSFRKNFWGILIGSSGTSFKTGKHFIVGKISQKDANKLHEIINPQGH